MMAELFEYHFFFFIFFSFINNFNNLFIFFWVLEDYFFVNIRIKMVLNFCLWPSK